MKNLLSLTLLMLPCVILSQITGQNKDSISVGGNSQIQYTGINGIQYQNAEQDFFQWELKNSIEKYKPLTLNPEQIFNVYVGLKKSAIYEKRFNDCADSVLQLNSLIQDQNTEIKEYAKNEIEFMREQNKLNLELLNKKVEIQELKNTKWYKSPWLYLATGIIAGAWVAK